MLRRFVIVTFVLAGGVAVAQTPDRFPAAKHGRGELRYVETVPVLSVRGGPAEIGEQFGVLAVKNAPDVVGLRNRFLKDAGQEGKGWLFDLMARRMLPGFPADHQAEFEAVAKACGRPLDDLLFANTIYDLSRGMGCSTVVVEKDRSTTGEVLFGRNLDWLPTAGITAHTLVAVFRPEGKRVFAVVTISPIAGCLSGMNDAGLCCTINAINLRDSKDKAAFDWQGTPMLLAFRRVLEECRTVAEAEALLRGMKRTCAACLTVADPAGGAVFEITPRTLEARTATAGLCLCTNYFKTDPLSVEEGKCKRMNTLAGLLAKGDKLGVDGVFGELDRVNQGKYTIESMVFEPAARALHLKISDEKSSATTARAVRLGLGAMFDAP
jgi:isopenicillin-N N-acyltransferase-like protein